MARVVLMFVILISGLVKVTTYEATARLMESAGIPGDLLPAIIAAEVLGAYAILLGWKTRVVSLLMAAFIAATAMIFHNQFGDPIQTSMLLKSLFIVGALLALAAVGAGPLSLDGRKGSVRRDHGSLSP
jgi:putative oxidoreductase